MRQPADETLATLHSLQKALRVFAASAIFVLLILIFWVASRISRPLELLAKQAERIEQGDESARLEIPTPIDELRHLLDALRGMTATMNQRREALARKQCAAGT